MYSLEPCQGNGIGEVLSVPNRDCLDPKYYGMMWSPFGKPSVPAEEGPTFAWVDRKWVKEAIVT